MRNIIAISIFIFGVILYTLAKQDFNLMKFVKKPDYSIYGVIPVSLYNPYKKIYDNSIAIPTYRIRKESVFTK